MQKLNNAIEEHFGNSIKLSKTIPLSVKLTIPIKDKKGFTLAEVLITLGIIGVVAALTIPTLMQRKQDQELVSQYKKTYSTLAQVIKQYKDNISWVDNISDWGSGVEGLRNDNPDFTKYFKGARVIPASEYSGGGALNTWNLLQLADGTIIDAGDWIVAFDINGVKKPNLPGVDQFALFPFNLRSNGVPGAPYETLDNCLLTSNEYRTCGDWVMRDGTKYYEKFRAVTGTRY